MPVNIQNPDYVADGTAVFVALIALVALLVSIRQLKLAKLQTTDAEAAATESAAAKKLMEQSVEYMRQQMELLSRTARLWLGFPHRKKHMSVETSKPLLSHGKAIEGWAKINLIMYVYNDGTRSAEDVIVRLLIPDNMNLQPIEHDNLALEGGESIDMKGYRQYSYHVDKISRGSRRLTDMFFLTAPLKERFKILWRIDHDDGPDPKQDYGELSIWMPNAVVIDENDGVSPDDVS